MMSDNGDATTTPCCNNSSRSHEQHDDAEETVAVGAPQPERARQYIYDRVSGHSYVPRCHRKDDGCDKEKCKDEYRTLKHRPPHFLCYVPVCVRRFPGLLEQNCVCELVGKIGFHRLKYNELWRRRIFLLGVTINFCSMILIAWAAMAYTMNENLLKHTSFSRGTARVVHSDGSNNDNYAQAVINIGFRTMVVDDPSEWSSVSAIKTYTNYCSEATDQNASGAIFGLTLCAECQASAYLGQILFNLFIVIRNQMFDVTRVYVSYDANCPNFHGKVLTTLSVLLGLWTINTYWNRCFSDFQNNIEAFYARNQVGEDGDRVVFEWRAGPGMVCLVTATLLRFVDLLCNFVVPAPSIARNRDEQEGYELKYGKPPGNTTRGDAGV